MSIDRVGSGFSPQGPDTIEISVSHHTNQSSQIHSHMCALRADRAVGISRVSKELLVMANTVDDYWDFTKELSTLLPFGKIAASKDF